MCSVRSRGDAYYFSAYAGAGAVEIVRADELVVALPAWLEDIFREQPGPLLAGDVPTWLDTQAYRLSSPIPRRLQRRWWVS